MPIDTRNTMPDPNPGFFPGWLTPELQALLMRQFGNQPMMPIAPTPGGPPAVAPPQSQPPIGSPATLDLTALLPTAMAPQPPQPMPQLPDPFALPPPQRTGPVPGQLPTLTPGMLGGDPAGATQAFINQFNQQWQQQNPPLPQPQTSFDTWTPQIGLEDVMQKWGGMRERVAGEVAASPEMAAMQQRIANDALTPMQRVMQNDTAWQQQHAAGQAEATRNTNIQSAMQTGGEQRVLDLAIAASNARAAGQDPAMAIRQLTMTPENKTFEEYIAERIAQRDSAAAGGPYVSPTTWIGPRDGGQKPATPTGPLRSPAGEKMAKQRKNEFAQRHAQRIANKTGRSPAQQRLDAGGNDFNDILAVYGREAAEAAQQADPNFRRTQYYAATIPQTMAALAGIQGMTPEQLNAALGMVEDILAAGAPKVPTAGGGPMAAAMPAQAANVNTARMQLDPAMHADFDKAVDQLMQTGSSQRVQAILSTRFDPKTISLIVSQLLAKRATLGPQPAAPRPKRASDVEPLGGP